MRTDELLGHNFVFFNAENEEVNVVYKRKDGSFGLIEPEFSLKQQARHEYQERPESALHSSGRSCYFLCMATAMADRQRRGIEAFACCFFLYGDCHGERQRRRSFALTPLSAAPHQSVRTSTHRLLPFYSSISSFCNLCFHSLYLSQRQ